MIRFYVFVSNKGGVGKSSLATLAAWLLHEQGRPAVVIDADFTGTSLADGLELCAPCPRTSPDGSLDLSDPTPALLSRKETLERRARRVDDLPNVLLAAEPGTGETARVTGIPYVNDVLGAAALGETDYRIESLSWRHPNLPEIYWLPSSPAPDDVKRAVRWAYDPAETSWDKLFFDLLDHIEQQLPLVHDVIIDLPPGLFGFTGAILRGFRSLKKRRPCLIRTVLVTSPDHNDLYAALEHYQRAFLSIPGLVPVVNRARGGMSVLREDIREFFKNRLDYSGIDELVLGIQDSPESMGRLFQGYPLFCPPAARETLTRILAVEAR